MQVLSFWNHHKFYLSCVFPIILLWFSHTHLLYTTMCLNPVQRYKCTHMYHACLPPILTHTHYSVSDSHTHTHIISLCWTHIYTYTHIYYTTLFDSYTFDSHAYTHTYTYVHQSHWSVHTTYSYVSYYFVPYTHTHLDNTVYVIYIHTLTYWHIERHTKI